MILDYKHYAQIARNAIGEGCVLLKNDNNTLPIADNMTVSVFGRVQINSYYCGTGSGGMVNAPYVVDILDGIRSQRKVNEQLVEVYQQWIEVNPYDYGSGWAQEPWCQVEMPLTRDIVADAAAVSDIAIMVVGRSAGEDKDSAPVEGSYYLNNIEENNLKLLCSQFSKVVVMLNCGNIMDMSWVAKYNPSAVLYSWHGGCESGNGYADVLCGAVNPSGRLTDTIAVSLHANATTAHFGGEISNIYQEDIFVGYRYFETFAQHDVLYPFGYGLSYTTFDMTSCVVNNTHNGYNCTVTVANTGSVAGKQVVQIYASCPQGVLGKASRVLVGFGKTPVISAGGSATIDIAVSSRDMASYDDSGATGHMACWVLEAGQYTLYAGFDVRNAQSVHSFTQDNTTVVGQCTTALTPYIEFDKLTACVQGDKLVAVLTPAHTDIQYMPQRIALDNHQVADACDCGYTFDQVLGGKVKMVDFVNQFSNTDLLHMARGEGMCSPKVTSGTAGCIGGVTDKLLDYKLPIACCSDGPSGIRMDSGTVAFSMPNGTLIASTFNTDMASALYEQLALEMVENNIDTILGPGINIHRNPLCGRNFEYFSEDPLLTGHMAVAQLKALHQYGTTGTIKHFACNSQENNRRHIDAVVSERALREIYLRAFEMAVVNGGAFSIMTSYNPINGWQAASNYGLTTSILRRDWGYNGLVMTDWWAGTNFEISEYSETNIGAMILCQNDVFMVNGCAQTNSNNDNGDTCIADGTVTRYHLLRGALNICNFLARLNCSNGYSSAKQLQVINKPVATSCKQVDMGTHTVSGSTDIDVSRFATDRDSASMYVLHVENKGRYLATMQLSCSSASTAQVSMTVKANGTYMTTITVQGGTTQTVQFYFDVYTNINTYLEFFFRQSGMVVHSLHIDKE